jgi:streptogramin lyase
LDDFATASHKLTAASSDIVFPVKGFAETHEAGLWVLDRANILRRFETTQTSVVSLNLTSMGFKPFAMDALEGVVYVLHEGGFLKVNGTKFLTSPIPLALTLCVHAGTSGVYEEVVKTPSFSNAQSTLIRAAPNGDVWMLADSLVRFSAGAFTDVTSEVGGLAMAVSSISIDASSKVWISLNCLGQAKSGYSYNAGTWTGYALASANCAHGVTARQDGSAIFGSCNTNAIAKVSAAGEVSVLVTGNANAGCTELSSFEKVGFLISSPILRDFGVFVH